MPVERMRMRPWLEEQIDSCQIPGLKWVNKEKRIFQIPWMHAARHGWDLEKDAPLFMRWAIHTGKYRPGMDRPDPKTWKANFRCAMNSLPDIEEVKDKSIKKGTNAFRVYKMLTSSERNMRKGKKRIDKEMRVKGNRVSIFAMFSVHLHVHFITFLVEGPLPAFVHGDVTAHSEEGHMVLSEQLPFVCQTVEVTTEDSEEQTVSSDTESDTEETNKVSHIYPKAFTWILVPCSLPSMSTFVSANKPNFRVTSTRDPAPLISYNTDTWTSPFHARPLAMPSASGHENRASVIRKTSDVTSS
uniref:Interferon regulatory factor n=1 Tax=Periophthalmus magnuspinnatus TaxID=409849 RepID=A0A3B4B047_9GOBI